MKILLSVLAYIISYAIFCACLVEVAIRLMITIFIYLCGADHEKVLKNVFTLSLWVWVDDLREKTRMNNNTPIYKNNHDL